MLELILGIIVLVALLSLIFVVYHNKFKISIIKMEEAENNIDLLLQKKLDLLKRAKPIVIKELKLDFFLDAIENDNIDELNHFELNDMSFYSFYLKLLRNVNNDYIHNHVYP